MTTKTHAGRVLLQIYGMYLLNGLFVHPLNIVYRSVCVQPELLFCLWLL